MYSFGVMPVLSSLACNLDIQLLAASMPLFEQERVAAIEWSFDALFNKKEIPSWFDELVQLYGNAGRLIGHGVFFSLFSGKWMPEQQQWLQQLRELATKYTFDHVTEHFGFMTGEDFHKGAPLGVPYTAKTLAIGQDRLKRIQDACTCPVGLENLAFACSLDEVRTQGQFLLELIEPVNGFIILDLHNVYCQLHNFSLDFTNLMQLYPLERVREIHISGGSWDEHIGDNSKKIRRDTHDGRVPAIVFDLLKQILPLCPDVKFVVLEQLGTTLETPESRKGFYEDFLQMDTIIARYNQKMHPAYMYNSFLPASKPDLEHTVPEDLQLYHQQQELSRILENAADYNIALKLLKSSPVTFSDWGIERWEPAMVETAIKIAQKWRQGWATS